MMNNGLMAGLSSLAASVVTIVLSIVLSTWMSKRKTAAETYTTIATGDQAYVKIARDAFGEIELLRRHLTVHDRRWRLAVPILEACAHSDIRLADGIRQLLALGDAGPFSHEHT